ncbi:MAG TPA: histidine phosphatase family protein [Actinocrinis sp.]
MGEIVLLRHGETEWSKAGRHTGRTDVPLTAQGEKQAQAAAPLLAELAERHICHAWSSPAGRAVRTAELAGLHLDGTDPDLWEWEYGGYEGVTTAQIHEQRPGWSLWTDGVIPGGPGGFPGETAAQVGERCDRVIGRVLPLVDPRGAQQDRDCDVVLVAHGHLLRVLASRWLGLPPADGRLFKLDTAAVSVLGFEHDQQVLSLWNSVHHH